MVDTYTAKYTRTKRGYVVQIVEWPEVVSQGRTLDEAREMIKDALNEMILASRQLGHEIPSGAGLIEQLPVEV